MEQVATVVLALRNSGESDSIKSTELPCFQPLGQESTLHLLLREIHRARAATPINIVCHFQDKERMEAHLENIDFLHGEATNRIPCLVRGVDNSCTSSTSALGSIVDNLSHYIMIIDACAWVSATELGKLCKSFFLYDTAAVLTFFHKISPSDAVQSSCLDSKGRKALSLKRTTPTVCFEREITEFSFPQTQRVCFMCHDAIDFLTLHENCISQLRNATFTNKLHHLPCAVIRRNVIMDMQSTLASEEIFPDFWTDFLPCLIQKEWQSDKQSSQRFSWYSDSVNSKDHNYSVNLLNEIHSLDELETLNKCTNLNRSSNGICIGCILSHDSCSFSDSLAACEQT